MQAFLKTGKISETPFNTGTDGQLMEKRSKTNSVPWVEKYRPKCVDDVVEQGEVVAVLRECLATAVDLPNLLLYGPPGTGKTSTILAAARQLFGDMFKERILELNASDDRGIAIIRNKVKTFAQLTASGTRTDGKPCPPFKIVILDEADAMTHAAQAALRRTMEKETKTTRFCLVCNYVSRIIEPITSRCTKFRFKPLGDDKIIERLRYICEQENVDVDDQAYRDIVDISGGDLRRAITTLQSCHRLKGKEAKIEHTDILEMSGVVPPHYLNDFISVCKTANYSKLEDYVKNLTHEAYSVGQLFEQMTDFVIMHDGLNDKQKSVICDKLGECCFRLQGGGSEYIQIMDLGCVTIQALQSN
ncbi:replication factor C subunit 4 [Malaya genurostris]|uniref:replication factor C subunit 4 n=1 Tax=Malaya genurostris TaxID=325434 RepID=UPI0026F3A57A|nr:replication factor C subunit 4 [Malaya genurostris]